MRSGEVLEGVRSVTGLILGSTLGSTPEGTVEDPDASESPFYNNLTRGWIAGERIRLPSYFGQ